MAEFFSVFNISYYSKRISNSVFLNKKNLSICKYLYRQGVLSSYHCIVKENKILVCFSYVYGNRKISKVKLVSKRGRRVYMSYLKLKKLYFSRRYLLLLSTSRGILNNKDAIRYKVGGELLYIMKC